MEEEQKRHYNKNSYFEKIDFQEGNGMKKKRLAMALAVAVTIAVAPAVVPAVTATAGASPAVVPAAAPDNDQQDDDPAAVSAAKAIVAHR